MENKHQSKTNKKNISFIFNLNIFLLFKILDLIIEIFNNNGSKELNIPKPESEGPEIPRVPDMNEKKLSKKEYMQLLKEIDSAKKIRGEMFSLWCTELYRLSIANLVSTIIKKNIN